MDLFPPFSFFRLNSREKHTLELPMSEYEMRNFLRRHYQNLDQETSHDLQRLRCAVLGPEEAWQLSLEEAFLD